MLVFFSSKLFYDDGIQLINWMYSPIQNACENFFNVFIKSVSPQHEMIY